MAKKDRSWYVYVLECSDGSYYVGLTKDLARRLQEHQAGFGAQYTHTRLPIVLRHSEAFTARHLAEERERQLKSWSRAKKKGLIEGCLGKLQSYPEKS